MTIWQVSPAYFSSTDLTTEYQELEKNTNENQFVKHRMQLIDAELKLRTLFDAPDWQNSSAKLLGINCPERIEQQYKTLKGAYQKQCLARINLPQNAVALWTHHKYAIMARNIELYKNIGKQVAHNKSPQYFAELCQLISDELLKRPSSGAILNVLQHMWGYIANLSNIKKSDVAMLSLSELLSEIQKCTVASNQPYLIKQVALSELAIWLDK